MKRAVLGGRTAVSPKAVRRAAVILLALATALALLAMIDAGTVAAQVAPGGAHNHAAHGHHTA